MSHPIIVCHVFQLTNSSEKIHSDRNAAYHYIIKKVDLANFEF